VRCCTDSKFLRPVFSASCAQHISDLHSKFALSPHHVWKYGRQAKKKKQGRKKEETTAAKYNALTYWVAYNNVLCILKVNKWIQTGQRSHRRPLMPSLHRHWPVIWSHDLPTAPSGWQEHASHNAHHSNVNHFVSYMTRFQPTESVAWSLCDSWAACLICQLMFTLNHRHFTTVGSRHLNETEQCNSNKELNFAADKPPPQPFYGHFSGTTRVSRCQKRTSGLYGARED